MMHGLMGRGIVLFPFLLCLCGLCLLSGKHFTQMQVTGGVLAGLTVLAVLHMNITYIDAKDDLLLGVIRQWRRCDWCGVVAVAAEGAGHSRRLYRAVLRGYDCGGVDCPRGCVGQRRRLFAAVQQRLEQIKEALLHFIFIEETDDDYEEDVRTPVEKTEPVKKSKNKGNDAACRTEPCFR